MGVNVLNPNRNEFNQKIGKSYRISKELKFQKDDKFAKSTFLT